MIPYWRAWYGSVSSRPPNPLTSHRQRKTVSAAISPVDQASPRMITRSSRDRRGLPGRVRRLSWLKATDSSATGGASAAMAPAISDHERHQEQSADRRRR